MESKKRKGLKKMGEENKGIGQGGSKTNKKHVRRRAKSPKSLYNLNNAPGFD